MTTFYQESYLLHGARVDSCEDQAGSTHNAAWCLDGATSLTGRRISERATDAVWLTEYWNDYLNSASQKAFGSLLQMVRQGVLEFKTRFESLALAKGETVTPLDFPSCCLSVVAIQGKFLSGYTLGDSMIAVLTRDDVLHIYYDDRVDAFDSLAIAEYANGIRLGLDAKTARAKISGTLIANRSRKNTSGGYWIIDQDPVAVEHAITFHLPIETVEKVFICTDGLLQVVDPFRLFSNSWSFCRNIFGGGPTGLKKAYEALAKFAASDVDCVRFPRFKKIDDVAGIVCRIVS